MIERGGIRFGIFGVIGKEAIIYTNGGAVSFSDDIEAAREMVKVLRETEKVDVVIALSHGGVEKGKDGRYTEGDDVRLAEAVPGIDVVISGHSHTELQEAIIVNGRTPVVQTGKEGKNLGELVITLDGGKLTVESYRLYPIDDTIAGDRTIADEIEKLKKGVTAAVFASRGYSIDQPLCRDHRRTCPTRSLDCRRQHAPRQPRHRRLQKRHESGHRIQRQRADAHRPDPGKVRRETVYDVFAVAPLGFGVVDTTAGSALVTGYFTGRELKNLLEFFLVDNPTHPGEFFPRASGMRFRYDMSRPQFDAVTAIELGDLDRGYSAIDITGKDERLYSLTCPLMLGVFVVAIPKVTKGKLALVAKNKAGQPLKSRVEALDVPRENSGYLLPPPGKMDKGSVATGTGKDAVSEIKEWQAIMDYLRSLPVKNKGELPTIPVDERCRRGPGDQGKMIGFGRNRKQPSYQPNTDRDATLKTTRIQNPIAAVLVCAVVLKNTDRMAKRFSDTCRGDSSNRRVFGGRNLCMKLKFVFVIILGLVATASAQAESRLFGLFPSDSPPKLLPGGFELTLTGSLGIVGINGAMGFKGKTAPLNVGFSDIPRISVQRSWEHWKSARTPSF